MHVDLGGYHISDIEFTAAFDVVKGKVGVDLADAIWAHPNDTIKFADVKKTGITVSRGMTHDGIGKYLAEVVEKAPGDTDDVVGILKETGTDVVVNYLPVGSEAATKWYAEQILDAGVAMVNCMPVFIAKGGHFAKRFTDAGLPLIGDDIKSQVGATISHRVLTTLFQDRGVHLDRTMQLNVGGNSDFLNMLERDRLESKKISKTNAVTSMLDYDIGAENVHVGPSDYVPWLSDRKWAYIRMEGTSFGDVPLNIELKLEVWDSPNSAGIVIDAVRLAKLALNNGIGGPLGGAERVPHEVAAEADPRRRGAGAHRALHQAERPHEDEGHDQGMKQSHTGRAVLAIALPLVLLTACGGSEQALEPEEQLAVDRKLIAAAWENDLSEARRLIEEGADVNAKDDSVQSAYLISTSEGYVELLELTLEHGADVTSLDSFNGTGLIRAADRGHVEIVRELLKTEIDVDHVNNLGWTALLEAIILGDGGPSHTEVVRLLVDAGADVNLADGNGESPLTHARNREYAEMVDILRAAGAR